MAWRNDIKRIKNRCGVLVLFVLGMLWVSYRLQDSSFNTKRFKVSLFGDDKQAGLITKEEDWSSTMSERYWPYMNNNITDISRTDPIWRSMRWHDDQPSRILYNRIPKTGSTMTLFVLEALSKANKFNKKQSPVFGKHTESIPDQEAFVQTVYGFKTPLVYDRHIYFIDFPRFGLEPPMYINIVREPMSNFVSIYYYNKVIGLHKGKQKNMTLDQCLKTGQYDCERRHRQLRFFCGQSDICRMANPPIGALKLAKRNIEQYYSVVGINEDLHGFFQLLEALLPSYFKGGSDFYLKHQNALRGFTTKWLQSPLKPESKELLKKLLKYDFELYDFVKQRLYKQKIISQIFKMSSVASNKTGY